MTALAVACLAASCSKKNAEESDEDSSTATGEEGAAIGVSSGAQPNNGTSTGGNVSPLPVDDADDSGIPSAGDGSADDTPPPPPPAPEGPLSLDPVPAATNALTSLNLTVAKAEGSRVSAWQYKIGTPSVTDCQDKDDYSDSAGLDVPLTASLGSLPDGQIRLCVIGLVDGIARAETIRQISWTKDTTGPVITLGDTLYARAAYILEPVFSEPATASWSQAAGPGILDFNDENTPSPTVTTAQEGSYTILLTATDTLGNQSTKNIAFVWDTTPPTVDAGMDISSDAPVIRSPVADGATSWQWYQLSGPGNCNFSAPTGKDTEVACDGDGAYEIQISGTDPAGNSSSDSFIYTVDTTAPDVDAGTDILTRAATNLTGSTGPDAVSVQWSQVSGPGTITFGDAGSASTTATASAEGAYVLRLTVADSLNNTASDEITFTWDTEAPTLDSMALTGHAADGWINATERNSALPLADAANADESATFSYKLAPSSTTCDQNLTYEAAIPPADSLDFGSEGSYHICIEMTDTAGNVGYAAGPAFSLDTLLPANAGLAGTPAHPSRDGVLAVTVSGTDVTRYRYKFGIAGSTDCTVAEGYSADTAVANGITDSLAAVINNDLKLCVIAGDQAGNYQSLGSPTEYTWTNDRAPPSPAANMDQLAVGEGARIKWETGSGDTSGYVVVRRAGSAITWTPEDGQSYSTGFTPDDGEHLVVHAGARTNIDNGGLTDGETYHYAVFAHDSLKNHAEASTTTVTPSARTPFNVAHGFSSNVRAILPSSYGSGDIYVGGDFLSFDSTNARRIIRLTSSYAVDGAFATGAGFNNIVYSLAEAATGEVYVGGNFTSYNGTTRNRIIRLSRDGTIDTGFNVGSGVNNIVYAMAIDPTTGDIYLGGAFTTYNGVTVNRIVRVNADGSIDSGFAYGTGFNNTVFSLQYDSTSQKLYVGGQFTTYQGVTANRIVALNPDGSIDSGFAVGTAANNIIYTMLRDPSTGDIYAGGSFTSFNGTAISRIIRLDADGARDTAFAVGTGFNSTIRTLSFAPGSADIVAGGDFTTYKGLAHNRVLRLYSDGSVHAGFDKGTGHETSVYSIAAAGTDTLIGGAFTTYKGESRRAFIIADDTGAASNVILPGSGLNSTTNCLQYDPVADQVYGFGQFTYYDGMSANRAIRLNADGTRDTSYAIGTGINNITYACTRDPVNDRIYVGGTFTSYAGTAQTRITAINGNGSRDSGFVTGTGLNNTVRVLTWDSTNNWLYAGGLFTTFNGATANRIVRILPDGTHDTTFNTGTGFNGDVYAISVDASGNIYVGGNFTTYNGTAANRIVRLAADGSIDSGFSYGSGFNGAVYAIYLDGSSVWAGGSFTSYKGSTKNRLIRLGTDGSADTSYGGGTGANSTIYAITEDPFTGEIVIGGLFTAFGGNTAAIRIAKVSKTGILSDQFVTGTSANLDIWSVYTDGMKIYAAGALSAFNDAVTGSVIRLQHYGAAD